MSLQDERERVSTATGDQKLDTLRNNGSRLEFIPSDFSARQLEFYWDPEFMQFIWKSLWNSCGKNSTRFSRNQPPPPSEMWGGFLIRFYRGTPPSLVLGQKDRKVS